jgi:hypothetical protein
MSKKILHIALSALVIAAVAIGVQSCISNDIPLPTVKLSITNLKVDGQVGSAVISADNRTVTINIDETVNIKKVLLTNLETTDGAKSSLHAGTYIDLSSPYPVTLSLYQDYQWTIIGQQTIDRQFSVKGQVGSAEFDETNKIAMVNVSKSTDLSSLQLQSLKLGPIGSTINMGTGLPTVAWTVRGNFAESSVLVNFSDYIVMERWTLYVFQVETNVTTVRADAWTNVAWLYGEGISGNDNGFEYREASASEWTKVAKSDITDNGGSFSARLTHLKAQTSYTFRAYSGNEYGEEIDFTTGYATELPNASFEDWHKSGKVWNPWAEDGAQIWDSGNDGTTTLGESNTQPTYEVRPGAAMGSRAAMLESKFVGIGTIGKFAAGNIFIGEFLRVDGTNGILDFGKPFTSRPTKLKGYYNYTTAPIGYTSDELSYMKGQNDTCSIYIALGDWSEPVEIRTRPSNAKYFDKNDPNLIAYAEFNSGESTSGYKEFELELDYRSTQRVPTYLIVVCSASKYGDYFTGGAGSVLYVDDFSLEYDY